MCALGARPGGQQAARAGGGGGSSGANRHKLTDRVQVMIAYMLDFLDIQFGRWLSLAMSDIYAISDYSQHYS